MTLPEMQQTGMDRVEARIGIGGKRPTGMAKELTDQYKKAYFEIDKLIKDSYAKHLTGIDKDQYRTEMLKRDRLKKLQKQIAFEYNKAARAAGIQQTHISKVAMSNTYYQNMYSVNWFSGIEQNEFFVVLNPKAVEVSVFGTDKVWSTLSPKQKKEWANLQAKGKTLVQALANNRDNDLIRLNQAVTQSLIQGKSYTDTTKAIKSILNTSANNALRIARTETTRNMNSGAYVNTQAAIDSGIEMGRMVVETLDNRTRAQSASIDGQTQKGLDPFIYPGGLKVDIIGNSGVPKYDINDRGRSIDVVEGLEPDTRTGIDPATGNPGIASYKNFQTWAKENGLKENRYGEIVAKAQQEMASTTKPKMAPIPKDATLDQINQWGKDNNIADNINFKDIDPNIAKSFIEPIGAELDRFPELRRNLKFVGTFQERRALNIKASREYYIEKAKTRRIGRYSLPNDEWIEQQVQIHNPEMLERDASSMAQAQMFGKAQGIALNEKALKGHTYNEYIRNQKAAIQNRFFSKLDDPSKQTTLHELGHQMDSLLQIERMPEIKAIFDADDLLTELSEYGSYNTQEMIAEAWAEYRGSSKPRPLAVKIGGIIEKAYNERYN